MTSPLTVLLLLLLPMHFSAIVTGDGRTNGKVVVVVAVGHENITLIRTRQEQQRKVNNNARQRQTRVSTAHQNWTQRRERECAPLFLSSALINPLFTKESGGSSQLDLNFAPISSRSKVPVKPVGLVVLVVRLILIRIETDK